ncbi:hypothetical protein Dimus_036002 [Dionaea muscipula]
MKVLRSIPMDGTFDPSAAFKSSPRLNTRVECRGSQLERTTEETLHSDFLSLRPLGFLASWPLFALSHHFLVWLAAERVYPGPARFTKYAVLGDDVVIGDSAFEFAKRFFVKKGTVDLSPVSMRVMTMVRSVFGCLLARDKYSFPEKVGIRLSGGGYRILGSLGSKRLGKRWLRFRAAWLKPTGGNGLPLEFWLGRGLPLNPYLKGLMVHFLRHQVRPKGTT